MWNGFHSKELGMKRAGWAVWIFSAIVFLPLAGSAQQHEQNITDRLLLGNILYTTDDQPAEQASVELWASTGTPVATTMTSWGGEFHFAELAAGEYLISVDKTGCEPLWEKVQVPLTAKRITLRLKRKSGADESPVSVRELSIPPKARIALRDGINLLKSDLPRAMANLQRAIALFPDYYEAYHVIGMADLMMDRPADAEQAFRRSIDLSNRSYVRPLLALGAVLCDEERFGEAESAIREGLELDDTPWIGHLLLARALFGLDRWNEAEKNANAAILRQPDVSDAYLLLANIHVRQKNAAAAVEDLDVFLKLEPDGAISDQARKVREEMAFGSVGGEFARQ
jgi:tetratricopeptide (TPR) repeat protein